MPAASDFTTRPELAGTFGMVASTHWLAPAAGMSVLEKGGNAFDAAVAAGLVLQVVEPHRCGPGGEVPVIGFDARRGAAFVIDGQGPAPAAAHAAGRLDVEERVGEAVIADLRCRGHEVAVCPPWSLGRVSAVARRGGLLYAAASPRGMQATPQAAEQAVSPGGP